MENIIDLISALVGLLVAVRFGELAGILVGALVKVLCEKVKDHYCRKRQDDTN